MSLKSIALVCVLFLLTSCMIIGMNPTRKTPRKPGKYPEFTLADTLMGSLGKYRANYDVHFYDLSLEVKIEKKYIQGSVDIYFKALEDIDTIQLDLYKNMTVDKILYGSDTLGFRRKYGAVFVGFNERLDKGKDYKVTFIYEGKPQKAKRPPWKGGFVWKKDKDGNPWIGVTCQNDGASLWWPVKDHLADEPDSMLMSVTIPAGLFCVSNGRLISRVREGEKENFTWRIGYPINAYNATFYIGNFQQFSLPYGPLENAHELDFYVLPYDLERMKEQFKKAGKVLNAFEYYFGEYPWWNAGYKLVESPYGGMEHQTAIAYGHKPIILPYYDLDYLIVHETAHEWWGNSVSAGDYADIWLHEGFATYCEALYLEYTKGYKESLHYLNFYSLFLKNKRPLVGPYGVNYWDYRDGDVYVKGALILNTLRNVIQSDSLFFDILRTYYEQYKYSITTTLDFINLVNNKTGADFNWFFDQYLYSRVCPRLVFKKINIPGRFYSNLYYKWENVDDSFKLPIMVKTKKREYAIYPTGTYQIFNPEGDTIIEINSRSSLISLSFP